MGVCDFRSHSEATGVINMATRESYKLRGHLPRVFCGPPGGATHRKVTMAPWWSNMVALPLRAGPCPSHQARLLSVCPLPVLVSNSETSECSTAQQTPRCRGALTAGLGFMPAAPVPPPPTTSSDILGSSCDRSLLSPSFPQTGREVFCPGGRPPSFLLSF